MVRGKHSEWKFANDEVGTNKKFCKKKILIAYSLTLGLLAAVFCLIHKKFLRWSL